MGHTSEVFDRKCAPSQTPVCESAGYDLLSYDQLHPLRKQRRYHKKDTKAALRTRLSATDVAERWVTVETARGMDTSSSVLGKRLRKTEETLVNESNDMGLNGTRPRGGVLAIAFAVAMSVVREHGPPISGSGRYIWGDISVKCG